MAGTLSVTLNEVAVRNSVTPMVDEYITCMKIAALKKGEERDTMLGHSEARFRRRLDSFAGEHGIFGQHRVSLNVIVDTVLNERATAAVNALNQKMVVPKRKGRVWGGWVMAALVLLIVF
ncbi:MAG: hypothetical protein WCO00_09735 [Rhodospirillaceae bacterium]